MPFLVDGYNLMHAAGYLTAKPTQRLEPIRRRFLDWLAGVGRAKKAQFRVVFDGQASPSSSPEGDHGGVKVRFSFGLAADDEIETLLEVPSPGLVVVSNDQRLHEAARRAHVTAWRCERFLDWVIRDETPPSPPEVIPPEKPTSPDADAELLAVFQQPRGRGR
ncbi:NYN domain-containing protein [Limnoglobus roseus]|uniref:NYN domain-containing protein n=1 Tax=Limnoglobus roseus TaxID=2598579 RepID=A0A5C1APX3_9BACT|nr:NYN domain-containing protein [Limnoglobus roseus]QEL20217.1 hypothetical protein PX52LOC_07306 [Limnoglobus roseus]